MDLLGQNPKLCDEYSVATLPSPAVTNSTSDLSLHHLPTMQSPSVQVMERRAEFDKYRIPSSVFSKTSTAAPVDWSIASNESLFSIHTGNMSFIKEQLMFVGKSGELGYLGDPLMSGFHNNFSSTHLPVNKTAQLSPDTGNLGEEVSVIEAAAETMKEALRENANKNGNEAAFTSSQVPNSGKISPSSDESMSSHESFAFPILTGDGVKSGSPQQPQQSPSQPQLQAMPTSAVAARRRWFFCFSCCQYGS